MYLIFATWPNYGPASRPLRRLPLVDQIALNHREDLAAGIRTPNKKGSLSAP